MADIGHPTPRLRYAKWEDGAERLAVSLQSMMRGETNNAGAFSLTDSSTTTVVTDARVGANSRIILTATTADAATEVGAGGFYASAKASGSFTVTHSSDTTTRTFDYLVMG